MNDILLTIVNTYWSKEFKLNSFCLEHLNKFIPISQTEVLICIDDCLSFNIPSVIDDQLIQKGFKVIKINEHLYAGGCRNVGIDYAKGEFIMFIDSYDDSIDSGKYFNLRNLLEILKKFISKEYCDCYELSNKYNKFYRAMPWNIFWRTKFLKEHNLKFIEWQGFEDFLFDFCFYKLNPKISIYLYEKDELLIFSIENSFKEIKCKVKYKTCYNHSISNTKYNYSIDNPKRYNEACEYLLRTLGYIPKEFVGEMIINNIDNNFGKELFKNNINISITETDIFKYVFKNIEEQFKNKKYLQIPFN